MIAGEEENAVEITDVAIERRHSSSGNTKYIPIYITVEFLLTNRIFCSLDRGITRANLR